MFWCLEGFRGGVKGFRGLAARQYTGEAGPDNKKRHSTKQTE